MKLRLFAAAAACMIAALAAPVCADGEVAFAYQGKVKVQGQPFDGTGQFKFSIVETSGSATLWSNDNTGENGQAPTGHLLLPVEDGIFNVIVGETAAGMAPINATIFNSPTPLKLRVWFNDGVRGFQQLNPDHNLVNLALTTMQTGLQDFTIYVNGQNGDDLNNGLTASSAKKTIQAAVDTLPERIRCNVTIDVADGIYRESVRIFGVSVEPGKYIRIIGDEAWVPGAGNPAVRVTGADSDGAPTRVRDNAFIAVQCSGVTIQGFQIDHCSSAGIQVENGIYIVNNCKITDSMYGVFTSDSVSTCSKVAVSKCTEDGFYLTRQSVTVVRECTSTQNKNGLTLNGGAIGILQGAGNYSMNAVNGLKAQHHSGIVFSHAYPVSNIPAHSAPVGGNGAYGLYLIHQSYSENHTTNNFSSPSNNGAGSIYTVYGGATSY